MCAQNQDAQNLNYFRQLHEMSRATQGPTQSGRFLQKSAAEKTVKSLPAEQH